MLQLVKTNKKMTAVFDKLLSFKKFRKIDGYYHSETLIWRMREFEGGLLIQFSDGVVNTLILEETGVYWKCNEPATKVVENVDRFKHGIKRVVSRGLYKKVKRTE